MTERDRRRVLSAMIRRTKTGERIGTRDEVWREWRVWSAIRAVRLMAKWGVYAGIRRESV